MIYNVHRLSYTDYVLRDQYSFLFAYFAYSNFIDAGVKNYIGVKSVEYNICNV